jgi:hypothetical protein
MKFRELHEHLKEPLGLLALFLQRAEVAYLTKRGVEPTPATEEG